MAPEEKSLEARVTIVEYRTDQQDVGLLSLRRDYTEEHAALRKSLQGIEKNLQAIKYVAMGAGLAFIAQMVGWEKAFTVLKIII